MRAFMLHEVLPMSTDGDIARNADRGTKLIAYTADLVFADGSFSPRRYVVVDGDTIIAIAAQPPDGAELIDFGQGAIYPTAVNTHTHSFQSLLRGRVDGLDLGHWLARVYEMSADYGPEECYVGAALSFGEMLRSGTTAVADFFYLNARGNDNVRAVIRAATDMGIRLIMGRAGLDAEWGGRGAVETIEQVVERFRILADEYNSHPLIEISPAPHSIYGASRAMIEAMYQLAVDYNTLWYIHVADPSSPTEDSLNRPGERTIPLLDSWGVLDHRLVLAHALFLQDEEVRLVAECGARISCNPASGMWFGDGILDIPRLWRNGVKVGLATDGAASNNALNLFREAWLASLGQKLRARDPAVVTGSQIASLATEDGGRVLNLPVGRLAEGYKADFMVLDTLDFSLQPVSALAANVVHAMSERAVRHVYCGGRRVVSDGELTQIDQRQLLRRAAQLMSTAPIEAAARQQRDSCGGHGI
jgi:5-methylthioadenosine/S-adenosylhomocysteine deaminase